jgi:hypothetical protein
MWAKENAISYYGRHYNKVRVIEFGANLEYVPEVSFHKINNICHLRFIGTNWHMKGGNKVMAIHNTLLRMSIESHLTIVGCSPDQIVDNDIITILSLIPYKIFFWQNVTISC